MRWVRYQERGSEQASFGRLDDQRIEQIAGVPFGEHTLTGRRVDLADVKLLPPVIPPTFYAVGGNYMNHFRMMSEVSGKPLAVPERNDVGYRAVNALVGPGDAIVVPSDCSGKLQYEGELVVVIAKKAKHLSEADALSCVFGYTIGNDVSERIWQRGDRTFWRGKNADTFKPMGPWIETQVDLDKMMTTVRLNDKEVSRFATNDMIFGVAKTIATLTRYNTLAPGDVIWMGTDEPTLDMVAGDTVEVELDGIGVLRNPVVAEA